MLRSIRICFLPIFLVVGAALAAGCTAGNPILSAPPTTAGSEGTQNASARPASFLAAITPAPGFPSPPSDSWTPEPGTAAITRTVDLERLQRHVLGSRALFW